MFIAANPILCSIIFNLWSIGQEEGESKSIEGKNALQKSTDDEQSNSVKNEKHKNLDDDKDETSSSSKDKDTSEGKEEGSNAKDRKSDEEQSITSVISSKEPSRNKATLGPLL